MRLKELSFWRRAHYRAFMFCLAPALLYLKVLGWVVNVWISDFDVVARNGSLDDKIED